MRDLCLQKKKNGSWPSSWVKTEWTDIMGKARHNEIRGMYRVYILFIDTNLKTIHDDTIQAFMRRTGQQPVNKDAVVHGKCGPPYRT